MEILSLPRGEAAREAAALGQVEPLARAVEELRHDGLMVEELSSSEDLREAPGRIRSHAQLRTLNIDSTTQR